MKSIYIYYHIFSRPLIQVHCRRGKHRTGVLCGLLRKANQWSGDLIFDEYRRFAYPKSREKDIQFIEYFDLSGLNDPTYHTKTPTTTTNTEETSSTTTQSLSLSPPPQPLGIGGDNDSGGSGHGLGPLRSLSSMSVSSMSSMCSSPPSSPASSLPP